MIRASSALVLIAAIVLAATMSRPVWAEPHDTTAGTGQPWGNDPFGGPPEADAEGGPAPARSGDELEGIIAGPAGMVAILNQQIVRIGDRIGAERVIEITPRSVILQRGQQTRRLVIRAFTGP